MTNDVIPAVLVSVASMAGLLAMYAVAVRGGTLQPATVDPFHGTRAECDPSADTVSCNQANTKTVLKPASDWNVATLSSLSQVEDLLDSLEAHGYEDREVVTLSDSAFAVRWK